MRNAFNDDDPHARDGGTCVELTSHPANPAAEVNRVTACLLRPDPHWLTVRWRITGAGSLVVPPFAGRRRAGDLWRTTCFELFVRDPAGGYAEFNFSPSENWAAYDFTGYREDMAVRAMPRAPVCTLRRGGGVVLFEAAIPHAALPPLPAAAGLSAVIEEEGGVTSYWALVHPRAVPDFHDPACFAIMLPAAPTA